MKSRFKPEELTEHQIFWMGEPHEEGCECGDQTCYQDEWLNMRCCDLNCFAEGPYCYGPHEEEGEG